ncbi:MAG: ThiF family adenylyltransferase [Syntrophothermus sp.]|uniref:ThiF family adenylyltransferase n=1 Tax=Syntrophothermus sp. TaxID=2736299 RepID=UPI00257D5CEF|nr:ThiF family adenylyltransferase [Syntrophothermus sp.]NSW84465.1 ThiF family adenylyltransferase [Syntrophothermus sp.]
MEYNFSEEYYEVVITQEAPIKGATILLVGTGGNGGYILYYLTRLLAALQEQNETEYRLIIADGDIVEEANCRRQNFIRRDIGRNKAQVLAERYSAAYGLNIEYIDRYIEDKETLGRYLAPYYGVKKILVGAVDNNRSRQLFHEYFQETNSLIWLDSGCDEWTGQVVCGIKKDGQTILPPVTEVYPDMLADKDTIFKSEESCSQRVVSAPQNIATNIMAGTIAFQYLNNILTDGKLETYMTTFSAKTSTARPWYITKNVFTNEALGK